jgi:transcription elongation factor Elf1
MAIAYRRHRAKLQLKLDTYKLKHGCAICGYKKFAGALDFHHKDPKKKHMRIIAVDFRHRHKRPLVTKELRKCIIVCSNCHRELTWRKKETK